MINALAKDSRSIVAHRCVYFLIEIRFLQLEESGVVFVLGVGVVLYVHSGILAFRFLWNDFSLPRD